MPLAGSFDAQARAQAVFDGYDSLVLWRFTSVFIG
jgi:hypothetical protein